MGGLRVAVAVLGIAGLLFAAGCGDDDEGGTDEPPPTPVEAEGAPEPETTEAEEAAASDPEEFAAELQRCFEDAGGNPPSPRSKLERFLRTEAEVGDGVDNSFPITTGIVSPPGSSATRTLDVGTRVSVLVPDGGKAEYVLVVGVVGPTDLTSATALAEADPDEVDVVAWWPGTAFSEIEPEITACFELGA